MAASNQTKTYINDNEKQQVEEVSSCWSKCKLKREVEKKFLVSRENSERKWHRKSLSVANCVQCTLYSSFYCCCCLIFNWCLLQSIWKFRKNLEYFFLSFDAMESIQLCRHKNLRSFSSGSLFWNVFLPIIQTIFLCILLTIRYINFSTCLRLNATSSNWKYVWRVVNLFIQYQRADTFRLFVAYTLFPNLDICSNIFSSSTFYLCTGNCGIWSLFD